MSSILRFFSATQGRQGYRIYVTPDELLCVRIAGKRPARAFGGGLVGAVGNENAYQEALAEYERDVESQCADLVRRGVDALRIYIKANKRGYVLDWDDCDEVTLDYVGKWKRWFFGTPEPALIVRHRKVGQVKLRLPEKKDVVIALFELQAMLGDKLQVGLNTDDYKKALRKYEKIRQS